MKSNRNAKPAAAILLISLLCGTACDLSVLPSPLATELARRSSSVVASSMSPIGGIRCRDGGTLSVLRIQFATPPNSERGGWQDVSALVAPERCAWVTAQGPIELAGAPHVVVDAVRQVAQGAPSEIAGTIKGDLSWTLRGQTVECKMNASYRVDLTEPRGATIEGTECEQFIFKALLLMN